jgi:ATP-dependent Lon protease
MSVQEMNESGFQRDDTIRQDERIEIPKILPVLPLPDVVTYPYTIVPLLVTTDKGISAVDQALSESRMVLLVTQRDQAGDTPTSKDMYDIGTVGAVIRMLKLPEQKVRVLVQGIARAKVQDWEDQLPYIQAHIQVLEESTRDISGVQLEALMRNVISSMEKVVALGKNVSQEVMVIAANLDDPGRLADLVASNIALRVQKIEAGA